MSFAERPSDATQNSDSLCRIPKDGKAVQGWAPEGGSDPKGIRQRMNIWIKIYIESKWIQNYMENKNIPWVEKYRPVHFENIVLDPINQKLFQNILSKNYFPNLLFYGSPGTGKTTTIMNLINEYQSKYYKINNKYLIFFVILFIYIFFLLFKFFFKFFFFLNFKIIYIF